MRLTKAGAFLLVSIVLLSICIAKISQLISVHSSTVQRVVQDDMNHSHIGDGVDNILWFIHISDIHLSIFQDLDRITDLKEFCETTVGLIRPEVVLASGDLTDAKSEDSIGSGQIKEEWQKYSNVLRNCNALKTVVWLDIRGNHDNFDVPGINSEKNYFRTYSIQGRKRPRSYYHIVEKNSLKYAFVGVDACPDQGLKRPFNFVGYLPESEMRELQKIDEAAGSANYSIWFGHYPTSCMLSYSPGIRALIGSRKTNLAYLCGHFHSLLGMVPQMYTLQHDNYLELELSDWKDGRTYRLGAIDHGLFSFADVKHRDWPVVLVTNPKHALFHIPAKEPLHLMSHSLYIRVLVFSPSPIASVRIRLNRGAWESAAVTEHKNIYVLKWDPELFSTGLHHIYVSVADVQGREKTITHPFSLDGTKLSFGLLPRLFLMLNFSALLQVLFGFATLFCVLPLCVLRYMNRKVVDSKKPLPLLRNRSVKNWVRRIWLLANTNKLFFPIVLYPIYVAIGPWAIGEIMEGHVGVIFIWGTFINGNFVPELFTYGYGFVQLFLFQGPLVVFTAFTLDNRLFGRRVHSRRLSIFRCLQLLLVNVPFLILLSSQIMMTYTFWLAYGSASTVLGPVRLWPIVLTLWSWIYASSVPISQLKETAVAWIGSEECSTSSIQLGGVGNLHASTEADVEPSTSCDQKA